MSSLLVYKASAGSGKTFTLAVEYIKLLIQNPVAYRNILAVTFTNKATGEMKERILSQLYGIATGDKDSKAYLQKICDELEMSAEAVRERAAEALTKEGGSTVTRIVCSRGHSKSTYSDEIDFVVLYISSYTTSQS